MKPITIHLTNLHSGANFTRLGVPLPKGAISKCEELVIQCNNHTANLNSVFNPLAYWPDGSVKWCLASIALSDLETSKIELTLTKGNNCTAVLVRTEDNGTRISVRSGIAEFNFSKNNNSVFPQVTLNEQTAWASAYPSLTKSDGEECIFSGNNIKIERQDSLSCTCTVSGQYQISEQTVLSAKFKFEILPDAQLKLSCELHNPQRAMHPGGIWDLGDPGSVTFKDFSLRIQHIIGSVTKIKVDAEWRNTADAPLRLFQASSGGVNWNSPAHMNSEGKVCNKFSGYQLTTNDSLIEQGKRSSPILSTTHAGKCWTIQANDFWQNFPKSIDTDTHETRLSLFPHEHGDLYELQGGERKTHHVTFRFNQSPDTAGNCLDTALASIAPETYHRAGVFTYFEPSLTHQPYDSLISPTLDPNKGFFAKREQADEFGWRNFGEVYADHEEATYNGTNTFISHYNNQYDCIAGLIKQYALTGDKRFHELFCDLTRHVMDIDIYRTEKDRVEYNNGLFWHTDHFQEAVTATHRTYSSYHRDQNGNASAGGGPGPEHCYSSGLMHYYYLTGDEDAKNTVLALGDWIHSYHEGTGTLLEAAKKTLQEESKEFIDTCKGKKIFKYHYLMNRGTGNYLRTTLDCYKLTSNAEYLRRAEQIIENTAGPYDEIDARGFEDVEHTWHYIVFIQELIGYLDLKRSLDQQDNTFYYARQTLLHYARWMLNNNPPYLHDAEKLEKPTPAWTAQETRKVHIFYAAYMYALKNRNPLIEKARFFRDYLTKELSQSETLHYTRNQALLMQNHGPSALLDIDSLPYSGFKETNININDSCFHTPSTHFKHIAGNWLSSLSKFRIGNELRWIRRRAS